MRIKIIFLIIVLLSLLGCRLPYVTYLDDLGNNQEKDIYLKIRNKAIKFNRKT